MIAGSLVACGDNSGGSPPPSGQSTTCSGQVADAWVSDSRICVHQYAADLGNPRQMAIAPNGDLFVNNGSVTVLFDADHNGVIGDGERATFATASSLNHGLAFSRDGAYVYASSETTVYRWPYTAGAHQAASAAEVVISGMPTGGHVTRTVAFDSHGQLYVSVGSHDNVEVDPGALELRAQIRRFVLPDVLPTGGLAYASGEVFAFGMRNEVGLYVDARDRLWGVENGRDLLSDGGDIHNDNPGEEVNLVDGTGAKNYGYPSCYTEFAREGGLGAGTQWADPDPSIGAARKTNDWCRDVTEVHPPAGAMQAHWAPLGVIEYQGTQLPFGHDLLVAAHGSWNRAPAVGRLVARLHRDGDRITSVEPILGERASDNTLREGQWRVRPVDLREASDGSLFLSDDNGGNIFHITYASP